MCRLTKLAHFVPINLSWTTEYFDKVYIDNIVQYHRILEEIMLDIDPLYTYHSWKIFQQALGTKIKLSTAYYS